MAENGLARYVSGSSDADLHGVIPGGVCCLLGEVAALTGERVCGQPFAWGPNGGFHQVQPSGAFIHPLGTKCV
jgi:hypothetical protein